MVAASKPKGNGAISLMLLYVSGEALKTVTSAIGCQTIIRLEDGL